MTGIVLALAGLTCGDSGQRAREARESVTAALEGDWEGTWGEVAMAFLTGLLPRETYDLLHGRAHPTDAACRP